MDYQNMYDRAYAEYHADTPNLLQARKLLLNLTSAYADVPVGNLSDQELKILAASYTTLEYIAFFNHDGWEEENRFADQSVAAYEQYLKRFPNDSDALNEYLGAMQLVLRYDKLYDVLMAMLQNTQDTSCRIVLLEYVTWGFLRADDYITSDEELAYEKELQQLRSENEISHHDHAK